MKEWWYKKSLSCCFPLSFSLLLKGINGIAHSQTLRIIICVITSNKKPTFKFANFLIKAFHQYLNHNHNDYRHFIYLLTAIYLYSHNTLYSLCDMESSHIAKRSDSLVWKKVQPQNTDAGGRIVS